MARCMKIQLAVLMATLALAAGCGGEKAGRTPPVQASVVTAFVESDELADTREAAGTVEADDEMVVAPNMAGVVQAFWVKEGDRVSEGKILFTLDDKDVKRKMEAARQAAAEAEAALSAAAEKLKAAESAKQDASDALTKVEKMYKDGAAAKADMELADAAWKAATTAADDASAEKDLAGKRAEAARRAVSGADALMGYTIGRSPIDGIVTERRGRQGAKVAAGEVLVRVVDDSSLRLAVTVEEGMLRTLSKGDSVEAVVDGLGGRKLDATVSGIIPTHDPKTRSFNVTVDLPASPGLMPGMLARALLPAGTRKVTLLPSGALVVKEGVTGVFVVPQSGLVRFRAVSAGGASGGKTEVIAGVAGGERVVVDPSPALRDGMKVD